jgi:hypothetical protein
MYIIYIVISWDSFDNIIPPLQWVRQRPNLPSQTRQKSRRFKN